MRRDYAITHRAALWSQHDTHEATVAAFAWHATRPAKIFELVHDLGDVALVANQEMSQLRHRAAIVRLEMHERPEMRDSEDIVFVIASFARAGAVTPIPRHWGERRKKALVARVHLDERLREQMIDRVSAMGAFQC